MEPTLSDDLQRYRWEAKVQAHGWNPYGIAPNDPRLAYLRDKYYEVMPGREVPAIYPPATELGVSRDMEILSGTHRIQSTICRCGYVGDVDFGVDVPKGERTGLFRVAIYAWNPLVIVEFAGSGHNDILALLGIVGGLALVQKRSAWASAPVMLATMAKVFPAVLLPVWIRKAGWPEKRTGWWAVALAGVAGLLVLAPYWNALGMFRATMTYYEATWKNYHASLYTLIDWVTGGKTRIPALTGVPGELGTGAVAGMEEGRASARCLSSDWDDTGVRAERVFVVLHLDCAAAMLFSKSSLADGDGAAVSVLQRVDCLRNSGGV